MVGKIEVTEALLDAIGAAEDMMEEGRDSVARGARWRAESMAMLRKEMPVSEIADRLGISRAAVYAALSEVPPADSRPEEFLDAGVEVALKDYLVALDGAKEAIDPFFNSGLVLTDERREMVAAVMNRVESAKRAYAKALRRAGRLVPYGLDEQS